MICQPASIVFLLWRQILNFPANTVIFGAAPALGLPIFVRIEVRVNLLLLRKLSHKHQGLHGMVAGIQLRLHGMVAGIQPHFAAVGQGDLGLGIGRDMEEVGDRPVFVVAPCALNLTQRRLIAGLGMP